MKKLAGFMAVLLTCLCISPVASAGVDDFEVTDYKIDYYLSKDAAERSTLKTVERITAQFPSIDQNHGIERAIPREYDGHPTSLKIESITNDTGKKLTYTTYESSDHDVIRIGDADKYVYGTQTYVLTYTQRDVTRYFPDTKSDEFYWDTNGTQWRVPIRALTASVHLDGAVRPALKDATACYYGFFGGTNTCDLKENSDGYTLTANNLSPGQNATLAVGFQPGTFAAYEQSMFEKALSLWIKVQMALAALGLLLLGGLGVWYSRLSNRKREHTTITPEYLPPKDMSVTAAAEMFPGSRSVFTAQILDLAVRHYLKIYQTKDKSLFRPAQYELEITKDIAGLSAEEQELLQDIFPDTNVGSRLALDSLRNNYGVAAKLQNNPGLLKKSVRGVYGLRAKDPSKTRIFRRIALVALLLGIILVSPVFLVIALISFIMSFTLWPLTDKGLATYHYLQGLKMYIKSAETERLRMLQSPEGAMKVSGVDVRDQAQLVKLYERVLPYAVLFGLEKEWNKQIGAIYESLGAQPQWYNGTGAFNAAAFSSGMSNFASAASYTTASSSTSGGSSGGGSSGGGGGGGGGGGW